MIAPPAGVRIFDELAGNQIGQERGAGIALGQDLRRARGDVYALVAPATGPLRPDLPIHPHLRRLVVIAFAHLLSDAIRRPAHALVLAVLLLIGQVVHDLLARQVCGDGLAATGMGAKVGFVSTPESALFPSAVDRLMLRPLRRVAADGGRDGYDA
jgi:hypothetical protein